MGPIQSIVHAVKKVDTQRHEPSPRGQAAAGLVESCKYYGGIGKRTNPKQTRLLPVGKPGFTGELLGSATKLPPQ